MAGVKNEEKVKENLKKIKSNTYKNIIDYINGVIENRYGSVDSALQSLKIEERSPFYNMINFVAFPNTNSFISWIEKFGIYILIPGEDTRLPKSTDNESLEYIKNLEKENQNLRNKNAMLVGQLMEQRQTNEKLLDKILRTNKDS
jgi:hypothetical protein